MEAKEENDTTRRVLQNALITLGKRNLALSKKLPKSSVEKYAIWFAFCAILGH